MILFFAFLVTCKSIAHSRPCQEKFFPPQRTRRKRAAKGGGKGGGGAGPRHGGGADAAEQPGHDREAGATASARAGRRDQNSPAAPGRQRQRRAACPAPVGRRGPTARRRSGPGRCCRGGKQPAELLHPGRQPFPAAFSADPSMRRHCPVSRRRFLIRRRPRTKRRSQKVDKGDAGRSRAGRKNDNRREDLFSMPPPRCGLFLRGRRSKA